MNKWIEEALQAPRDAWGLLLGLVSAFSILALVRHEFASEPIRVVMENWNVWSFALWNFVGQPFQLSVPHDLAVLFTAILLTWIVFARGYVRGQSISPVPLWLLGSAFVVSLLAQLVVVEQVLAPVFHGDNLSDISLLMRTLFVAGILVWPLGMSFSFLHTPRSFFGVVIAGLALLLIDRIPILPAAA